MTITLPKDLPASRRRPAVLTIAGSDSSCGAGIQADLKTFSHFGCYGLTALTCVVAEVPGKVTAIQPIRRGVVVDQIALSFAAFPVAAVKTGLLSYSASTVEAVAELLASHATKLVVDPVMVASSGDCLLKRSAITAYQKALFPLATLVTPNLDELKILAGRDVRNRSEMREAGAFLAERLCILAQGRAFPRQSCLGCPGDIGGIPGLCRSLHR